MNNTATLKNNGIQAVAQEREKVNYSRLEKINIARLVSIVIVLAIATGIYLNSIH